MTDKYSFSKAKAIISQLVKTGISPDIIVEHLNNIYLNCPKQSTLENSINTKLYFTWDSSVNLWLNINPLPTNSQINFFNKTSDNQMSFINSSPDSELIIKSIDTLYESVNSILKENKKLQNKFESYLSHREKNISTDDIVKYYNDINKKKTSICLNMDLYNEVETLISEKYGVNKSTTQIINTSLLLISIYLKEQKSKE